MLSKFLKPSEFKYTLLTVILTCGVILSPILSNRIIDIFTFKATLGTILVTIMYGFVDVINNDFGIKKAKDSVLIATITKIIMATTIYLLLVIPFFKETIGFLPILSIAFRIEIATVFSLFISQYFIDVKIFDYFRSKTQSFFIRYTLSNLSQIIGISIMILIAFAGTGMNLFHLIIGNIIIRFGLQFLLTPFYALLTFKSKKI